MLGHEDTCMHRAVWYDSLYVVSAAGSIADKICLSAFHDVELNEPVPPQKTKKLFYDCVSSYAYSCSSFYYPSPRQSLPVRDCIYKCHLSELCRLLSAIHYITDHCWDLRNFTALSNFLAWDWWTHTYLKHITFTHRILFWLAMTCVSNQNSRWLNLFSPCSSVTAT